MKLYVFSAACLAHDYVLRVNVVCRKRAPCSAHPLCRCVWKRLFDWITCQSHPLWLSSNLQTHRCQQRSTAQVLPHLASILCQFKPMPIALGRGVAYSGYSLSDRWKCMCRSLTALSCTGHGRSSGPFSACVERMAYTTPTLHGTQPSRAIGAAWLGSLAFSGSFDRATVEATPV